MKILGIDTSSMRTCVSIVEDDFTIASYEMSENVHNSEEAVNMISEIFEKVKFNIKDIDLISVGIGPGSFTGTRIAVTIARTFAQTLNKPIVGVSSLRATSLSYEGERYSLALFDAKRNRAYFGLYNGLEEVVKDDLKSIEEIAEIIKDKKVALVGTGARVYFDYLKEKCDVILPRSVELRAENIAKLGKVVFDENALTPLEEVLPNYINPSQAQSEYDKRNKK